MYLEWAIAFESVSFAELKFTPLCSGNKEYFDLLGQDYIFQLTKKTAYERDRKFVQVSAANLYISGKLVKSVAYGLKKDDLTRVMSIPQRDAINKIFTLEDATTKECSAAT